MADLGATTYTAVVWTTGDTITEAKLDNMVANDQAYDSHAAQGLLLDNNKAYCAKDSGGTARNLLKLNASDIVEISGWDAWCKDWRTWTYASATTITVPSGAASRHQVGDKIKITQTTVKYFKVTVVADTLLTVWGLGLYTVANAAITLPFYSKAANPQGWVFNAYPSFSAYKTATTALAAGVYTKVIFDSKEYDYGGVFDHVTNNQFTAPIAGIYHFDSNIEVVSLDVQSFAILAFFKGGAEEKFFGWQHTSNAGGTLGVQGSVDMLLAAGDTVDVRVYANDAATAGATSAHSYFTGHLIG